MGHCLVYRQLDASFQVSGIKRANMRPSFLYRKGDLCLVIMPISNKYKVCILNTHSVQ